MEAHIHASGWISGCLYLQTVDALEGDEGAIEFSLHGYDYPIVKESIPKLVHTPADGDIVLFPSSLFHRTIPFTENSSRCVIGFDLLPSR